MAWTAAWDFANDKSLTDSFGNILICTRASTRKYFDSAGVMQEAAANKAGFDHNPSTLESLGLVVEEARTNIVKQSEDFSTTWINGGTEITVDANATTAPDDTTTADRIGDSSGTGTGTVNARQSLTSATSTAYVLSAHLKADGLSWGAIYMANMGAIDTTTYFNLATGVVGTEAAGVDASGIEDVGDGWYRCWVAFTSDAADTSVSARVAVAEADNDQAVELDGTSSIFVWGAQLEAGSFPTSYIPTVASSVTRNKDLINIENIDWVNETAGTIYSHATLIPGLGQIPSTDCVLFQLSTSTQAQRWQYVAEDSNARNAWNLRAGGDVVIDRSNAVFSAGNVESRAILAATLNNAAGYRDGIQDFIDLIVTPMPTGMTRFSIGSNYTGASVWNGHIHGLAFNNLRLPNTDLSDLSDGTLSPFSLAGASGMSAEEWYRRRRRLRGHRNWLGGAFISRG